MFFRKIRTKHFQARELPLLNYEYKTILSPALVARKSIMRWLPLSVHNPRQRVIQCNLRQLKCRLGRELRRWTIDPQSGWSSWHVSDQRFLSDRRDVLNWETESLAENVTVTGDIMAHLFASTTGTDSDWVVKLIDAYPDNYSEDSKMSGYQLMVASEVFRGRFRKVLKSLKPLNRTKSTNTILICAVMIMSFAKDIELWFKFRAVGFRSTTAIRKSIFRIFFWRKKAIFKRCLSAFTVRLNNIHT